MSNKTKNHPSIKNMNSRKMRIKHLYISICLVTLLFSCQKNKESEKENKAESPQELRIITAGGNITESLYLLGLGEKVIATESSSNHPKEAQKKQKLGYVASLKVEPILAEKPTHVFCSHRLKSPKIIEQLYESVNFKQFNEPKSFEDMKNIIKEIAKSTNSEDKLAEILEEFKKQEGILKEILSTKNGDKKPKVAFIMAHRGSIMAAGDNSSAQTMINIVEAENVFTNFESYKGISNEVLLEKEIDFLFNLRTNPMQLSFKEEFSEIADNFKGEVIDMSASYIVNMGPRMIMAAQDIAKEIYKTKQEDK